MHFKLGYYKKNYIIHTYYFFLLMVLLSITTNFHHLYKGGASNPSRLRAITQVTLYSIPLHSKPGFYTMNM